MISKFMLDNYLHGIYAFFKLIISAGICNYMSRFVSEYTEPFINKERLKANDKLLNNYLKDGIPKERLCAFIEYNYLPVAFHYAYNKLKYHYSSSDKIIDKAQECALDIISNYRKNILDNSFRFEGNSRFSTYLYSSVTRYFLNQNDVPDYINKMGVIANRLYFLVFKQFYTSEIAVKIIVAEFNIKKNEADKILADIFKKIKNKKAYRDFIKNRPSDEIIPEIDLLPNDTVRLTDFDPELKIIKNELQETLHRVMTKLNEEERLLITLRFINGETHASIAEKTKLKSIKHRIEKAKKSFINHFDNEIDSDIYLTILGEGS